MQRKSYAIELFPGIQCTILLSLGQTKHRDLKAILTRLHDIGEAIILTNYSKHQDGVRPALDPKILAAACREEEFKNVRVCLDPKAAYALACQNEDAVIVVTGSYFLLNHVRPIVKGGLNHKRKLFSTQHPAPSTQHPAPSTQHPAPSTQHTSLIVPKPHELIQL